MPYGGIYVKSIVPGGPAAKEGQILRGKGRSMLGTALSRVMSPGLGGTASRPCLTPTLDFVQMMASPGPGFLTRERG